jgi:hypothetical protein
MAKTYSQFLESLNRNRITDKSFPLTVAFKSISNLESELTESIISDAKLSTIITETDQTPLHQIVSLYNKGRTNVTFIIEESWADSYKKLLEKYNGHLFSFKEVNIIPTTDSVRPSIQKEYIREAYLENKIYNVGDFIFENSTGLSAEIIDRGSNYIRSVNQLGEVNRHWLNNIAPLEVSQVFPNSNEFYKGNLITSEDKFVLLSWKQHLEESTDPYKSIMELRSMNFLDTPYNTFVDQSRLARIFATVIGIEPNNLPQDPKMAVNMALLKLPGLVLSPRGWDMISTFIEQLNALKIKYNKSYLNAIKQHLRPGLLESEHMLSPKTNLDWDKDGDIDCDDVYNTILDKFEANASFLEDEINNLTFDDIEHLYDEDEFVEDEPEDKMHEAISPNERILRAIRFKRMQPILQLKRKLVLARASTPERAAARARHMAVSMIKNKLLHGRTNVPASEKARVEALIARRKALISRTATKLVPKIKTIERKRLL